MYSWCKFGGQGSSSMNQFIFPGYKNRESNCMNMYELSTDVHFKEHRTSTFTYWRFSLTSYSISSSTSPIRQEICMTFNLGPYRGYQHSLGIHVHDLSLMSPTLRFNGLSRSNGDYPSLGCSGEAKGKIKFHVACVCF